MPIKSNTENWVEALRISLRDLIGNNNWQIRKGERDKVRLDRRFQDGSQTYKYLPYI